MAARTAITITTTISSISVKPRTFFTIPTHMALSVADTTGPREAASSRIAGNCGRQSVRAAQYPVFTLGSAGKIKLLRGINAPTPTIRVYRHRTDGLTDGGGCPCRDGGAEFPRCDRQVEVARCDCCLLYTSDAADERSSVDLGGR